MKSSKVNISKGILGSVYSRILVILFAISLLSPFLANDIPLYTFQGGKHYFPVFGSIMPGLFPNTEGINWQNKAEWGEFFIMPPIPYHSRSIDLDNAPFIHPFENQNIKNWRYRHWLGTDDLGRDVLAGLLHGSTVSLVIGVLATLIAVLTGIFIGGIAGFLGDDQYRPTLAKLISFTVAFFTLIIFAIGWFDAGILRWTTMSLLILICSTIYFLGSRILEKIHVLRKHLTIPVDLFTLRIIETMRSIPDLFLIIGLAAIIDAPGIFTLVFLIAFLRWPVIARYVRAEMLKVRSQDYITYARGTGLPRRTVFWKYALPNALTPVWVLAAFSVAIAILLESSLSFLGIGIPVEWVTWGSMLNLSRRSLEAWHLAIFPGLAMFAVIYFFNTLGEKLEHDLRGSEGQAEI